MSSGVHRPVSLTIAALGGQGGGVVADWMIAVARREHYLVQATSVPGVAQRTGATIYYLEFFPERELPADGRRPVMALMPNPGDVDVVVASELVEAGRALQRGLVTPDRTTLIASTHRAYTIGEKSSLAARPRGRRGVARRASYRGAPVRRVRHGGAGRAAWCGHQLRAARCHRRGVEVAILPGCVSAAIREGGIAVETNLAAFEASYSRAQQGDVVEVAAATRPVAPQIPQFVERVRTFPAGAHTTLMHGVARLIDYQDSPYASEYLDRVSPFAAFESGRPDAPLTEAVARGLALWMSFEDTLRVAQLKTRPARIADIERRLRVKPGQVVEVREFLKPRVEEICGTLPAPLGRRLLASPGWRRRIERFTGGRQVRTSTITGFAFLRALAGMRRWRRGTLRYAEEQARIEQWLSDVAALAHSDYDLATEVARCQPLVRGYGDTHSRGLSNHARLLDVARRMSGQPQAAGTIARLRRAANVDEQGEAFDRELAALGLG